MNLGPTLHSDNGTLLSQSGLPRKVLRQLIQTSQIGIGSRVLKVGQGCGGLNDFLSSLGIQVWEVSDSIELTDAGSQHRASAGLSRFDQSCFDLVLVHDLATYHGTLHSSAALRATAQLLSCVRPGGTLSFVQQASHQARCFEQHLEHFPGAVDAFESFEGGMQQTAWQHLFRRTDVAGSIVATLTIPTNPITAFQWLRLADECGQPEAARCCHLCREPPAHAASLPKAA